jgi:uncharacterized membrane protein YedE/YeeE
VQASSAQASSAQASNAQASNAQASNAQASNAQGGSVVSALVGGVLIGLAATLFWQRSGRVAGVSGIVRGALLGDDGRGQQISFLAGLVVTGAAVAAVHPLSLTASSQPLPVLLLAGALVGFGTRLAGGCTSGHGVCGLSRFSLRSLAATVTFVAAGAATVFAVTHLLPDWVVR